MCFSCARAYKTIPALNSAKQGLRGPDASSSPLVDHPHLAVLPHEDHVPVALGGPDRKIIAQGSPVHDRFHTGRVRLSCPTGYDRASGPHVLEFQARLALRAIARVRSTCHPCILQRTSLETSTSFPYVLLSEHTTTAAKSKDRLSAPALQVGRLITPSHDDCYFDRSSGALRNTAERRRAKHVVQSGRRLSGSAAFAGGSGSATVPVLPSQTRMRTAAPSRMSYTAHHSANERTATLFAQ